MTTQEQAERRAAFYADLRSENFPQARNTMLAMIDEKMHYCCLAVGQQRYQNDKGDAADTRVVKEDRFAEFIVKEGHTEEGVSLGIMSTGARDYYGFLFRDPTIYHDGVDSWSAAECNDSKKMNFPYIADMFEAAYPAVANEQRIV